jgi:hypothetical protein
MFLKAAAITEPAAGKILLELPQGPGIEMLAEPAARAAVESALAERLGRAVSLDVRTLGAVDAAPPPPVQRLTPERMRAEQLARLIREQPALDRAVRAWDLEIVE